MKEALEIPLLDPKTNAKSKGARWGVWTALIMFCGFFLFLNSSFRSATTQVTTRMELLEKENSGSIRVPSQFESIQF